MKRLFSACFLALLASAVWGDDIDIYAAAGPGAREVSPLVLVVDWAGAAEAGSAGALPQLIVGAIERHLAWRQSQPGLPGLQLALLQPREMACDELPACEFDQARLLDFGELATGDGLPALRAALDAMAIAATDPERGFPPYRVSELWPQLRQLLDARAYAPGCRGTAVVHLLQREVAVPTSGVDPAWTAALRSSFIAPADTEAYRRLARLAPGRLLVTGGLHRLETTLLAALAQFIESDATLLSAVVPAFSPAQVESGSEVLFPMFRPTPAAPWPGNLKALRLVDDGRGGSLLARAPLTDPPLSGVDPGDGAIHREALTFWTDPMGWDVQDHDPALGEVAGADGRSVRRGGAGQGIAGLLRGVVGERNDEPGARQVFFLAGEPGSQPAPLDADEATAAALSLPVGAALGKSLALLRHIRGIDATDLDGDGDVSEPRGWLLGAVMHSQPLVLNYGARPGSGHSLAAPDVRVVYGGNDGLLHMLASSPAALGGGVPGREIWSILPGELLDLQLASAGMQPSPDGGYPYGVDGSPVAYIQDRDGTVDSDDGDRVWVFFGLRRGGAYYHALDLTDPDRPLELWQLSPASPGFERLALSFSTPRVVRLDLGEPEPRLALAFAGGYHGGWRGTSALGKDAGAGPDPVGNAVFVVDAATGALIWRAQGPGVAGVEAPAPLGVPSMVHSIPAPLTVVDGDGNGITDRAYVADTGGRVWRVDLPEAGRDFTGTVADVTARWSVRLLADLGGSARDDRRFFHALDYSPTRDGLGAYDALLLASGDRAHPLETGVENFAYLLKDRGAGSAVRHDQLTDVTITCRQPDSAQCREADLSLGWKMAFSGAGEKGLSPPHLRSGVAYFTTYQPPPAEGAECVSGVGEGAVYAVRLGNAAPAMREIYRARTWESGEMAPAPDVRRHKVGQGIPGAVVPHRELLLLPGNGPDGERVLKPPGTMRWLSHWRENGVDLP